MRTKLPQCHVLCWVSAISALLSASTATWQVHSRREEEASAAAFLLLALDHHIVSCRLTWSASVSCKRSTEALCQPRRGHPAIGQQPQKTAQQ